MPAFSSDDLQRSLSKSSDFIKSVAYTPPAVRTVLVLSSALTYGTMAVDNVPRIQVTGPYGCGKSTTLSAVQLLVQNPVRNSGQLSSQWAIRNDYRDGIGPNGEVPTLLMDETKQVFGPDGSKGGQNPLYSICCEGYSRDGARIKYQEKGINVSYSCYQVAFLGGRGERSLPEDVLDRAIRCTLSKKPKGLRLLKVGDPVVKDRGHQVGAYLRASMTAGLPSLKLVVRNTDWYAEHGLDSRDADKWIGLFAIARLAGGPWPALVQAAYAELGDESTRQLPADLQVMVDVLGFLAHEDTADPERFKARDLITYLADLGRKSYEFDGEPYTVKRYGMLLTEVGVQGKKSNSVHYYRVTPEWLIAANKVAYPRTTTVDDPDNELAALDEFMEDEAGMEVAVA